MIHAAGPRRENLDHAQVHDLSADWAGRIVTAAQVSAGDRVLEVGAGTGALTAALLAAGAQVTAIERDEARAATLRTACPGADIVVADAVRQLPVLRGSWRVVANPPFNLTALLVRRWLAVDHPGDAAGRLDLVLQAEAASKLTGQPGHQSRTSVLVALAGTAKVALRLPRHATAPPSRVDLALWSFRRSPEAPAGAELRRIDAVLARGFSGAHTLQNAMKGMASALQLRKQGAEFGYKPTQHPRTLTPAAWRSLTALLALCGKV
jgi:16S rRNA A1518/A1519 N6-dimethyltransferase RsmA/KsgA/DIM1 with predicted DNA glycosylase/AP lyase activity